MSFHSNTPPNSQNYEQYLQYISDLDISPKQKYELLYIVNSILSYFVDQAFGVQTDQITLHAAGKIGFNTPTDHVTIEHQPEHQTADAQSYGVEGDSCLAGMSEP